LKQLIVTADDVGLDPGMTAGAIEAHRNGIVTACSIVANGRAFDDAVSRLRDVASLAVGVHLTLVEEVALTTGKPMPRNWTRFLFSKRTDVEREMRAQIEKVLATGLAVTHLNGHQHLHMMFLPLVRRLASEYKIGYVRNVRDRGGPWGGRRLIFSAVARRGASTIGVVEAGHLTAARIIRLLDFVEERTELVTHPGLDVRSYPHWKYEWDEETRALSDPRVKDEIVKRGIALIAP
jgi:chitin disaccharide deacetylase